MTNVNIPDNLRSTVEQTLKRAISAAKSYDGKEASADRLLEYLADFENYAQQFTTKSQEQDTDAREAAIALELLGPDKPVTAMGLFEEALVNFGKRLSTRQSSVATVQTNLQLIPTKEKNLLVKDSGRGLNEKFDDFAEQIIIILNEQGIYADDILIYGGKLGPNILRQCPYNLIQIPRLNRELLICNQVGETGFIGKGLRGPLFWATYSKQQLQLMDDITRLERSPHWRQSLIEALFADNMPQAKIKFFPPRGTSYPLSEDIILVKALEYAQIHEGSLPTQYSGEVQNMLGQKWANWQHALRKNLRALARPDVEGLSHLFQLYGLKIGRLENPKVVVQAINSLQTTGHHGLVFNHEIYQLSEDLILNKAIEYAISHDGRLPTPNDDTFVPGMPGQKWSAWSQCVKICGRGLKRENLGSLSHLFRLYGLRMGQVENPKAIAQAIKNFRETGHHGLSVVEGTPLTEDLILLKALEHAQANGGILPTEESGGIKDMSGQTWAAWHSALFGSYRGLTREGVKGLPHLYRLYGLKMGRKENPDVIKRAIENIAKTGSHGLKAQEEVLLTEELILTKALEYFQLRNGELPTVNGGEEVPGMPGQTWAAWHGCINQCMRGLTRQNMKGLPHLFRLYGLKISTSPNSDVINKAIKNLKETGHHNLVPVKETPFTEDSILGHALKYADGHGGKLPRVHSGEVVDLPGQRWATWHGAIKRGFRGLARGIPDGLRGLYTIYGLEVNGAENSELISKAIANVKATGHHGLKRLHDRTAGTPNRPPHIEQQEADEATP